MEDMKIGGYVGLLLFIAAFFCLSQVAYVNIFGKEAIVKSVNVDSQSVYFDGGTMVNVADPSSFRKGDVVFVGRKFLAHKAWGFIPLDVQTRFHIVHAIGY